MQTKEGNTEGENDWCRSSCKRERERERKQHIAAAKCKFTKCNVSTSGSLMGRCWCGLQSQVGELQSIRPDLPQPPFWFVFLCVCVWGVNEASRLNLVRWVPDKPWNPTLITTTSFPPTQWLIRQKPCGRTDRCIYYSCSSASHHGCPLNCH